MSPGIAVLLKIVKTNVPDAHTMLTILPDLIL